MEQTRDTRHRKYGSAAVKQCPKCRCEYFTRVSYNKFKDEPTDLFNGDREVVVDYRATLLKCLRCDHIEIPIVTYGYASGLELEIADEVNKELTKRATYLSTKTP